ncbi:MAG: indole-3-glycerol-phosphate synthase [Candidatus Thorarchaeota archaeon]|nr:MAG: indole-3-glycerol-phosphate synthase [Candidatus Thorarchaeota archaeon]
MKERLGEVVGSIVASKIDETEKRYSIFDSLLDGRRNGIRVIAELKPASPSQGNLSTSNFDVENIATAYTDGGASALSVLVEPMYFGGSYELIQQIRNIIDVPILAKGFIFKPIHVAHCSTVRADAFLLMVRVVEEAGANLQLLLDIGRSLGMEAVVEAASSSEVRTAISAGAKILQINSRNIYGDLSIDLLNIREARNLPEDVVLIAASGISKPDDMKQVFALSENRVDAVLVGTSLMKSADPTTSVRELVEAGQAIVQNQGGR